MSRPFYYVQDVRYVAGHGWQRATISGCTAGFCSVIAPRLCLLSRSTSCIHAVVHYSNTYMTHMDVGHGLERRAQGHCKSNTV